MYSLGNIFYMMLSQQWPWEGLEEKEAIKRVMDGRRPEIPESIRKSNDPAVHDFARGNENLSETRLGGTRNGSRGGDIFEEESARA